MNAATILDKLAARGLNLKIGGKVLTADNLTESERQALLDLRQELTVLIKLQNVDDPTHCPVCRKKLIVLPGDPSRVRRCKKGCYGFRPPAPRQITGAEITGTCFNARKN